MQLWRTAPWGHGNKKHCPQSKIQKIYSLGWFKWKTSEKLKDCRKISRRHDLPDWGLSKHVLKEKMQRSIVTHWRAILESTVDGLKCWSLALHRSDLKTLVQLGFEEVGYHSNRGFTWNNFLMLHQLKNDRRRAEYILYMNSLRPLDAKLADCSEKPSSWKHSTTMSMQSGARS